MSAPGNEPIMDVARGDRALSEHLANSLKLLRDRSDNPEFRRLADEIVAGRASLREAAMSAAFTGELNPQVERFAERYEQLTDAEREELARQGEQQFAERNEQLSDDGSARERPAPPEDDDGEQGGFLV